MNAPTTLSRWNQQDRAGSLSGPTPTAVVPARAGKNLYGPHWCYVGLAIEIPNVARLQLSHVGERQVVMVRDRVAPKDRDTLTASASWKTAVRTAACVFCRTRRAIPQLCLPLPPVDLQAQRRPGRLPFKDGVKDGECVNGGMPAGFDLKDHGLTKLRVAVLHGLVFATFSEAAEPLEDYLGAKCALAGPIFKGRQTECGLQPPAHSGQLEADDGKHQGSLHHRACCTPGS